MKQHFLIALLSVLVYSANASAQEPLSNIYNRAEKTLSQIWNCKWGVYCPEKANMFFQTKSDYMRTSEFLTNISYTVSKELQGQISDVRWLTTVDKKKISVVYFFDNGNPEKRTILGIIDARYSFSNNTVPQDKLLLLSDAQFTGSDKVKNKEVLLNEINANIAAWQEN